MHGGRCYSQLFQFGLEENGSSKQRTANSTILEDVCAFANRKYLENAFIILLSWEAFGASNALATDSSYIGLFLCSTYSLDDIIDSHSNQTFFATIVLTLTYLI